MIFVASKNYNIPSKFDKFYKAVLFKIQYQRRLIRNKVYMNHFWCLELHYMNIFESKIH